MAKSPMVQVNSNMKLSVVKGIFKICGFLRLTSYFILASSFQKFYIDIAYGNPDKFIF